ncbi:hypothetical protein PG984_001165 [Apiospora sp. TS-2023a]
MTRPTIDEINESSQHFGSYDGGRSIFQHDDAVELFEAAIQAIRSETYRAHSQVKEALQMSQASQRKGCPDGSMSLPGIGDDHKINKLLGLHAYGRARRHKVDLIKEYITFLGMKNAPLAPKRNKRRHEDDSLMLLPQKHRIGTVLDMNTVQSDSMVQSKVEDSELVLAFLLPAGDYQYVEAITGNVKDKAGIGETCCYFSEEGGGQRPGACAGPTC